MDLFIKKEEISEKFEKTIELTMKKRTTNNDKLP